VGIIRTTGLFAVLLGWLVNWPALAADDKIIIIDKDLAASAEVMPVTVAAEKTFNLADFRFGEYVVVSSKVGMAKGHSIEWISPLESDENEQKFSFVMNVQRNVAGASEKAKASSLSDGTREIEIRNVSSDAADGGEQAMPARGYEFREGDRAIAALQYYGGGYPTSKKHLVVFLRNDLDPQAKLLLAAAMTAILQSKVNATLN
jgi:hypothetical protein